MKSHQHADLAIEDLQKIFNPSTLTTEKRASLFMEVKHRLTAMIRSVKDYKTVFSYLNPEECLDLYQSSKDQLIEMLDQEILDLDKMKIISW